MEITEVRIKLVSSNNDKLRAFCSITLDNDFVVRDLKVIEGTKGPFVAMPSRKLTQRCGRCGEKNPHRANYCSHCGTRVRADGSHPDAVDRLKYHADIAHPINSRCREMIQNRILESYSLELERAKAPDYKPTDLEVFDEEFLVTEVSEQAASVAPRVEEMRDESASTAPWAADREGADALGPGEDLPHRSPATFEEARSGGRLGWDSRPRGVPGGDRRDDLRAGGRPGPYRSARPDRPRDADRARESGGREFGGVGGRREAGRGGFGRGGSGPARGDRGRGFSDREPAPGIASHREELARYPESRRDSSAEGQVIARPRYEGPSGDEARSTGGPSAEERDGIVTARPEAGLQEGARFGDVLPSRPTRTPEEIRKVHQVPSSEPEDNFGAGLFS